MNCSSWFWWIPNKINRKIIWFDKNRPSYKGGGGSQNTSSHTKKLKWFETHISYQKCSRGGWGDSNPSPPGLLHSKWIRVFVWCWNSATPLDYVQPPPRLSLVFCPPSVSQTPPPPPGVSGTQSEGGKNWGQIPIWPSRRDRIREPSW